ncbi:MAG: glycosyltransferase, partial [Actinomycetota bacterium]
MNPRATVAILTYNAGGGFQEVLDAVSSQETPFEYEVLVIDSGSSDGTVEIAKLHRTRLIQISNEEFQHGRTRNLAMEMASGEFVVFLTHDATPASPFWLRELISCFEGDPKVAAAFGPHLPRPGTDPIVARELLHHFQNFGPKDRPTVHEIAPGPEGMAEYRAREAHLGFFSDVNGCLRRSAWAEIPYRELDYAEDQRMGRDLLEAGYKIVYCPAAPVYHSHSYGLREYFRRMYDEFTGLLIAVGYKEDRSLLGVFREGIASGARDAAFVRSLHYLGPRARWRFAYRGAARALLRRLAAYLAVRHARTPRWARRRLSLEGGVRRGPLKRLRTAGRVARDYGFGEFRRLLLRTFRRQRPVEEEGPPPMPWLRVDPARPAPLLADRGSTEFLTINWILPPIGIASGGHQTLFNLMHELERSGHRNRIYLYHASDWMDRADAESERALLQRNFRPLQAEVRIGVEEMESADALVATSWLTAYLTHQLSAARARFYLVQDLEPYFHPVGSDYVLADNTYRLGLHCITAGRWLARLLAERHGAWTAYFDLAPEHSVYRPSPTSSRLQNTLVFYGRWKTERRGFELAAGAFQLLSERRPDLDIQIFGAESLPKGLRFKHRNLGLMRPEGLAHVYNNSTLGFVVSLTNPSLIPIEMMACGLPVLDLDTDANRVFYEGVPDALALADPYP